MNIKFSYIFGLLILVSINTAQATVITLNPGSGVSWVRTAVGNDTDNDASMPTPTSTPFYLSVTNEAGGSSSTIGYDFSNSGFNISFDQTRGSSDTEFTWAYANIFFSVNENVLYSFSGDFVVNDSGGTSGEVKLYLSFGNVTTNTNLFVSNQISKNTINESLVLGAMEADTTNQLIGSATGTLSAGNEYRIAYFYSLESLPSSAVGTASALGSLGLVFKSSKVSAPATLLLLGTGLALLILRRRNIQIA